MQCRHWSWHEVPVICTQSVESPRNGACGAVATGAGVTAGVLIPRARAASGPACAPRDGGWHSGDRSGETHTPGQKARHDPVGRGHDLADLEIDRDAAQDVGLLPGEPALAP